MRLISAILISVAIAAARVADAAPTAGEKCAAAKLKAAGNATAARLRCYATAVTKNRPVDPECLAKADDRLIAAFSKAERKPGCSATGDADVIEKLTEGHTASVVALLPDSPVKYVFVLVSCNRFGSFGGQAAADAACAARALARSLPGTYKAWLSDSITDAATRLSHSPSPYVLIDGTKVADGFADLTDGTVDHAINLTELGETVSIAVWTGTTAGGSTTGSHCDNWTSSAQDLTGTAGQSAATDGTWTNGSAYPCRLGAGLYCVQQ